jgi:pimeloyl-ACP methyl ester carboxylesterase
LTTKGAGVTDEIERAGRRIRVCTENPGGSRAVLMCHPAPGAGGFDPDPEQTDAHQVRLISLDRPGYGGSDPVTGSSWSTVDSAADDAIGVLEKLAGPPVGVVGWSAGGRVALAIAARRPDLVDRVVVIATPAPDEVVGWIPPEHRELLDALRGEPAEVANARLAQALAGLVPDDPASAQAMSSLAAAPADEQYLAREPALRERLASMLALGFEQGATGLAADIAGYCLRPWGFEPANARAKTLLVYGEADPLVGPEHGRWWRDQLPDATLLIAPNMGHLAIAAHWASALEHLTGSAR